MKTSSRYLVFLTRPLVWGASLGIVGLLCGYYGQDLLLKQPGTVAPVMGLLDTGPKALVAGVLLGLGSAILSVGRRINAILLFLTAVGVGTASLYYTVQNYESVARLIDAEIVSCTQVDKLLQSRKRYWTEEATRLRTQGVKLRDDWEREIQSMVRSQSGVVVSVRVYRDAWITEQKWRWGGTSERVERWKEVGQTEDAFMPVSGPDKPTTCNDILRSTKRGIFLLGWEHSNDLPPDRIGEFVGLYVLQDAPERLVRGRQQQGSGTLE